MTEIKKEEVEKLLKDYYHLRKYVKEVKEKIGEPTFYSQVPKSVKEEENPNVIYATKGVVFIHIVKTKDMEKPEYRAITPILNDVELKKRELVLERMYEIAHLKTDIKTQNELRKAIREAIDKITIVDESSKGKIVKATKGKIRVSSIETVSYTHLRAHET